MKINKLPQEIYKASINFGLLSTKQKYISRKITDGVSSDIWHVKTSYNEFCIKRALEKLTVKEDWYAPIDRNDFEAKYFTYCKTVEPNSFPKILGHDNINHILAMEWFDNKKFLVWKKKLLEKSISLKDGKRIGKLLGLIHKSFFRKRKYEKIFLNDKTFYDIRIEPYLVFTSKYYPEFSAEYKSTIDLLTKNKSTIIHGDFSPKNILLGKNFPVILDAETACWGNPVFDLAFLNNHVILKSILNSEVSKSYFNLSNHFLKSYFASFPIMNNSNFIKKFIILQALLILARVDGKSPVEYFTNKHKNLARTLAKNLIANKSKTLNVFYKEWEKIVKT